jgi:Protein of unknown function (DUF2846)
VATGMRDELSPGISLLKVALKSAPALLCLGLLTGCVETKTTTYEPQNRALDARQARLYFIRHPSTLNGFGAPPIKVDGKLVGELGAGSYFITDRPAGTHKLTIMDVRNQVSCESDVTIAPGMSYYFELGPQVRTNIDAINAATSWGVTGRPIPCGYAELARMMFYSLDATTGAAVIAKLKERNS